MAYNKASHTDGFTVLELLLVIGLMAVIAGFLISGFVAYGTAQQFRSAVIESELVVREVRQRTVSAETDTFFGIAIFSNRLDVYEETPSAVVRSLALPGVEYIPALTNGTTTLSFSRLVGLPSATGTITVRHLRTGDTATITISDTGLIQ